MRQKKCRFSNSFRILRIEIETVCIDSQILSGLWGSRRSHYRYFQDIEGRDGDIIDTSRILRVETETLYVDTFRILMVETESL